MFQGHGRVMRVRVNAAEVVQIIAGTCVARCGSYHLQPFGYMPFNSKNVT